jgi:hypothetical protein
MAFEARVWDIDRECELALGIRTTCDKGAALCESLKLSVEAADQVGFPNRGVSDAELKSRFYKKRKLHFLFLTLIVTGYSIKIYMFTS